MTLAKRLRVSFLGVLGLVLVSCAVLLWATQRVEPPAFETTEQRDAFEARRRLMEWLVGGVAVASAIAVLVGWKASTSHLTEGMRELRWGAAALGAGDLHHEVKLHGHDEFAELAKSFGDISRNLALSRRQLAMANRELEKRNAEIDQQRQVSESLLRNILPGEIADELSEHGLVEPKGFDDVTILFTDFVGFTRSTENMSPGKLVEILHGYFTEFDKIVRRYGLEKLKTIGDSYMCAGGLPTPSRSHPVDAVLAALEMIRTVDSQGDHPGWAVRIGIHTGPVTAGVVGIDKFAFDVWGRTVNFSSRVETTGAPNRVNISAQTHARVREFFDCEDRGKVRTKENVEYDMYFVESLRPELLADRSEIPPPAFVARYRGQFGAPPKDFPTFLV